VSEVLGIDLSPQMVAEGLQYMSGIPSQQGNMLALIDADSSWTGEAAYSLVHFSLVPVRQAFQKV
jgi:hypothetical protein